MGVLTGANGALKAEGTTLCRVRNWNLNITRDALDITCLGQEWREYEGGLRGATGSATLMYDATEAAPVALMNKVFSNTASASTLVEFVLGTDQGRSLRADCIVTSSSAAVTVGEVTTVDVQFQVTGEVNGRF